MAAGITKRLAALEARAGSRRGATWISGAGANAFRERLQEAADSDLILDPATGDLLTIDQVAEKYPEWAAMILRQWPAEWGKFGTGKRETLADFS